VTIRKGQPWGEVVARPDELVVAPDDAGLAALIVGDPAGAHAVAAGDLHRTVGSPDPSRSRMHRLPIDVLHVETDHGGHLAVAHVIIRRRWWRGRIVVVCNVGHVGEWNVAPRAHPNDGRFDLVDVDAEMPLRARLQARRRLPTGLHVPHPRIATARLTEWSWADPAGARVWVDGVDVGRCTRATFEIEPDATFVYV
jgi:hypothetical protein